MHQSRGAWLGRESLQVVSPEPLAFRARPQDHEQKPIIGLTDRHMSVIFLRRCLPSICMSTSAQLDSAPTLARSAFALRVRLARAVAAFCGIDGPSTLGYASLRDYARGRAGISLTRFLRLRRVGLFLRACPQAGTLPFSVVDHLAQRVHVNDAPTLLPRLHGRTFGQARAIIEEHTLSERRSTALAGDAATEPDYERVSFTVPHHVAAYLHQTLDLASAMLGHDTPPSETVDAVVAEAGTEVTPCCDAAEARFRFGVSRRRRCRPAPTPPAIPSRRPSFRRDDRRAAFVLDRHLRRLIDRERRLRTRLEDAILQVHVSESYRDAGYASFAHYGRDVLGLPRATLYDLLDRARARRRHDPVGIALADGGVTAVAAQLLQRLQRRCHVPPSGMASWIELARGGTVRDLFEAIDWARAQRDTDYRAWSTAGFPPPSPDQVRTSVHPVADIATHPTPEILADTSRTPTTSVQWVLQRETLDVLLQLMATSRQRGQPDDPLVPSPPSWWCLLDVFVTARRQWSVIEREPSGVRGQVLRRDDYRCVVPHCSQRRSLQVHHIHFRSAGGDDDPSNQVTLCAFHHKALHDGRIRIRGKVESTAADLIYEIGVDPTGRPLERFVGQRRAIGMGGSTSTAVAVTPAHAIDEGSTGA
jgi:hypothetical protein